MESKRKLTKKYLLLAVCALALTAVLVVFLWMLPSRSGEGWTVMVYMVGSDLETEHNLASRDLEEMAGALSPDTKLFVMAEGIISWEDSPNDGTCRIWEVNIAGHTLLGSYTGSMGNPAALQSLLSVGLNDAKGHAALILWDHGYGPMEGFGNDLRSEGDRRLTLSDLADALRNSGCGDRPLSLIGFDACLMAGCETALALRPYAQWMLASQETEPPEGWDYSFLRHLKPGTDPQGAGNAVIHAFVTHYEKLYADFPDAWQPYTLSLTDLRKLEPLEKAVSGLFRVMETDIEENRYRDVGALRLRAWGFGRSTTSTEFDLIDLRELAEACKDHPAEASAVITALNQCVVTHGGSEAMAHGLSVYFPQYSAAKNPDWDRHLDTLPLPEDWRHFLYAYTDALASQGPAYDHTARTVTEGGQYALELSDDERRDLVRAGYYVLKGDPEEGQMLICARGAYSLDGNRLTVPFGNRILTATADGKTLPLVSIWRQEDDQSAFYQSYALAVQVDEAHDTATPKAIRIRVEQDKKTGVWSVRSAFSLDADVVTGRQEYALDKAQFLQMSYTYYLPLRDPAGRLLPYSRWEYVGAEWPLPELNIRKGFTVAETDLPPDDGPYWLQIVVWDAYNQSYGSELIPIQP